MFKMAECDMACVDIKGNAKKKKIFTAPSLAHLYIFTSGYTFFHWKPFTGMRHGDQGVNYSAAMRDFCEVITMEQKYLTPIHRH